MSYTIQQTTMDDYNDLLTFLRMTVTEGRKFLKSKEFDKAIEMTGVALEQARGRFDDSKKYIIIY